MAFQSSFLTPESAWVPIETLPNLSGARRVSIDCETCDPGLKSLGPGTRRGSYVVGVAVGVDDGPRFYLPIRHQGGGNLDPSHVLGWLRDFGRDFAGQLVGANLAYDLDFLENENVVFPKAELMDVQLIEAVIHSGRFIYSLDSLAKRYGFGGKDETALREAARAHGIDAKSDLWRLPASLVGAYAEGDVDLPLKILKKQLEIVKAQNLEKVLRLESQVIPVLLAMRRQGVRVDVIGAERLLATLDAEQCAALSALFTKTGRRCTPTNINSFIAVVKDLGYSLPLTPTGKPSLTLPWLQANASAHPVLQKIVTLRENTTLINTFLRGYILGQNINGRLHCVYNQLKGDKPGGKAGAKVGTPARLSSAHPNLQNIPKGRVKKLFLPEPGERWIKYDWSQVEYRLLAHYARGSGADAVRKAYMEDKNTDFHKTCQKLGGAIDPRILEMPRSKIKTVNFSVVYGGGKGTLAKTLVCTVEQAADFLAMYDKALPFVRITSRLASQAAKTRGYVQTLLGRRRHFDLWALGFGECKALPLQQARAEYGPGVKRAYTHKALNAIIQDSAADIMKQALVDVGVSGPLGCPLLTVHDELGFSAPEGNKTADAALLHVKTQMESVVKLRVPMIAEMGIAKNWGDCG